MCVRYLCELYRCMASGPLYTVYSEFSIVMLRHEVQIYDQPVKDPNFKISAN